MSEDSTSFERETVFFRSLLESVLIRTRCLAPGEVFAAEELRPDGLPGIEEEMCADVKERELLFGLDSLLCSYCCLRLPENQGILLVGPYLRAAMEKKDIMSLLSLRHMPPSMLLSLQLYYERIPVIKDRPAEALMRTFCQLLWGEDYSTRSIRQGETENPSYDSAALSGADIHLMEKRYQSENGLLREVVSGNTEKALRYISKLTPEMLLQRIDNPLRSGRNYAVILNTLLRKAAEHGGVHPLYLHKTSSGFSKQIESVFSFEQLYRLFQQMIKEYCALVQNHAHRELPALVRDVLLLTDGDVTADLSLKALSAQLNVSAPYLSALFKKHMGCTITEYVSRQRMKKAKSLLKNTDIQIQDVAQYCGISDAAYFTKIFQRETGLTPKEYRRQNNQPSNSQEQQ